MNAINWKKLLLPNIPYLFFVYLFDKVGQAVRLSPGADLSGKVLSLGEGFSMAFANPLPSFAPMDLLIGIAGAVLIRLMVYFNGKNAKKYRKGIEYGSARWGTAEDIKPYTDPVFQNNVLLTQTERLTIDTDICFRNLVNGNYAALPRLAVVELKRDGRTSSPIRDILSRLHVHPAGFSKYCMGCVLTDENLKQNRFKPKVRKMRRAEIPRNIETLINSI